MTSLSEDSGPFEAPRPAPAADQAQFVAPHFSLRDFLTVVFYDRAAIMGAFLLPFLGSIGLSFLVSTTFEAEARLLVLLGREYIFKPDVGEQAGAGLSFDRDQMVKAELEILDSRELKVEVIRAIGLDELYPGIGPDTSDKVAGAPKLRPIDKAVDRFERNLKLTAVQGSNVIQLSFWHREPQLAAEALNLLIRFYIDKRREVFLQSRTPFLKDQREQFAQRLQDTEARLLEFRRANAITNVEEQIALLLKQESEQNSQILQIEERIRGAMAQVEGLKAKIAETPVQVLMFSDTTRLQTLDAARTTLLGLELRRRDLLTKYRQTSRIVQDLDQQIAEAKAFLDREGQHDQDSLRYGRNPVLEDLQRDMARLEAELKGLGARKAELGGGLARVREALARISALAQEFRALERDRQLLEDNYITYTNRLEEAKISEDFDRTKAANIRIIAAAEPPAEGRSLRLPIVAAGGFLGLVASMCIAFALALTRQTFLTPEDVERALGLPVLVAVPLRGGRPGAAPRRPERRAWL